MPKPGRATACVRRHSDGAVWGKGRMLDGRMHGYWEWFRRDATRMRSGHFDRGRQVGEWITYDKKGRVLKVTQIQDPANQAAVDEYIAKLAGPGRAAIAKLRRLIKRGAPGAEEAISYAIPSFRLCGMLVWYAAFKHHASLFAPTVRKEFARELRSYEGSKASIHFPYDKPLPAGLITRVVKAAVRKNVSARVSRGA